MAITFVLNDEAVNDQTSGLDTGDSGDGFTDTDVAYASLPQAFQDYLEDVLLLDPTFPTDVGVATKTNSVTVEATGGSSLTGITFTDGAGGALTGDPATDDSGLDTVDGKSILLVADGDNTVIGKYDSDGNGSLDAIAFVIFKEDNVNATATQAEVTFHIVTYTPIFHDDDTDPDDAVDLGESLKLAASERLELDFADLPSGQNLFGTIAVDKTDLSKGGLLLFPKGALLNAAGTFTNASPTTNTSQGGGAVTIGNSNQMFDPGEGHFFIYVDDPVAASVAGVGLNQNNADDADTIGFNGTLPQTTAQVEIVQVQGNDPASIKITAYDFTFGSAVDTNGEARDLVTDPLAVNGTALAPTSATEVNITGVRVLDGNGVEVENSDGSTNSPSITINLTGNTAVITGLQDDYTVEWTAPGHDGVLIEGVAGKYDLGGFNIVSSNAASEFVGQQIVIEDDGPAVSANLAAQLDDDALTGGNPGGTGDVDPDTANTSGTLGHSFGTDGAGSIAFLTTGAPSGFTYVADGDNLLIKQGATTVVTVTLNTVTGAYTVTQNAPIMHVAGLDENDQAFTLSYRVTDGDGDTADGTLAINVDDDTPMVSANLAAQLDDDALTGGNPGGTGDVDPDTANTSGTLGHSFGADGAGSIAFLTTGAPSGFTYELSGSNLLIKQNGTTVVTVTLTAATGAYTVTQNAPIVHAAGLDENDQAFTLNYRVTDGDGDTADGTLDINVDDDTPVASGETETATVQEDDLAVADGDSSDGIDEAGDPPTDEATGSVAALVTSGADEPATFTLSADTSGLSQTLTSQGDAVTYTVVGNTLTATADAGGLNERVVFTLTLAANGDYTFDLKDQLDHPDGSGDDALLALDLSSVIVATDFDGDSVTPPANAFVINVENDVPVASGETETATVQEDDLAVADGDSSDGIDEAGDPPTDEATGSVAALVTSGADEPATFTLSADTSGLSQTLTSQGDAVTYTVVGNTLTATADAGGLNERVVFTLTLAANGDYTFDLKDQLDHPDGSGDDALLALDLSSVIVATDFDGDSVTPPANAFVINVENDVPVIGPIADSIVDFAAGSTATKSLLGARGTDDDSTYTITDFDTPFVVNGVTVNGVLSDDAGTVNYFGDDDGTPGVSPGDTLYYSLALDQTDPGAYTFTVHVTPPPALLELDFADLPSGQNLHGTIAVDKTDLSDGGLLLFPKGALLNAAGTFTNASPTTNTSQGGGAVTIGNSNQMFDPGEGHFFIYVDDPVAASVAGVGLNQNNADDADTIGFNGTLPQTTAQVEIVQVQGNDPASIKITAYDFTFGSAVDTNGEARDLVTDPLAVNGTALAPTSATEVNITGVRVLDGNGVEVENSDGSTNSPSITINLTGNTAVITGLQDDYTVEWTAPGHDGVLIEGVAGKYDLGGFNIQLQQPTPDQKLDFTVQIADADGDTVSDSFSIGIDGTGTFDDNHVDGVIA